MKWSIGDIERLKASGKIKGYKDTTVKRDKKPATKPPQPKPKPLQLMEQALTAAGITFETEYRFHPERKFRFDIAIPHLMTAIEYEGLMSKKSRHTTVTGYSKDASKYNLAQQLGWKVYRYTAMNYKEFSPDLIV
jgi:hypothetical protein